jgi:hypothetical protein
MKNFLLLFCFASVVGVAQTKRPSLALIVKAGSVGIAPELSFRVNERVHLRGSFSFFNYQLSDKVKIDQGNNLEKADIGYDAKVSLKNAGVLIDYYPFKKVLALNAGVFYNLNTINVDMVPQSDLQLNDRVFKPAETGTLALKASFRKVAPYVGLSLGNPHQGRFRVLFDAGVLYTGSPMIEMQGTGAIEPTASQAPQLEQNLKPIYLYPVVKLGFSYRIL